MTITNADYHADPAISASHLHAVAKSPYHYWSRYLDPKRSTMEPTAAMRLGSLALCAVLEPDELSKRYAIGYAGGRDQAQPCPATATYLQCKMSDSDIYWTFVTAGKYGGKFFQLLGNAGLAADPINKRLILNTWPMMVATYGTASRLHQTMRYKVAV